MVYFCIALAFVLIGFLMAIVGGDHPIKGITIFISFIVFVTCNIMFFVHSASYSKNIETLQLENYKLEENNLTIVIDDKIEHYDLNNYTVETFYSEEEKIIMKYHKASWEGFILYLNKEMTIISFEIYTNKL